MKALNFQNMFLGLCALLLLAFGVPRFLASVWIAAGDPIYRDLAEGVALSENDINSLIESRETALMLVDWPHAATDLGTAYYFQNPSKEGLDKAITYVKRSLEMAPISAFAWHRLANLQSIDPERHTEAVKSWETSRRLSLHEPFLYLERVRVGIILYRSMSDEQREMLRVDAEKAYSLNRGLMRNYGQQNNLLEWFKFLLRNEEKTAYLSR